MARYGLEQTFVKIQVTEGKETGLDLSVDSKPAGGAQRQ
jgi:hypothetical protein